MKARHIRRIRLKLKNEKFLMSQLEKWAQEEKRLDSFYRFHCSSFFEGETMAQINRKKYYQEIDICHKNLSKFKRRLKDIGIKISRHDR